MINLLVILFIEKLICYPLLRFNLQRDLMLRKFLLTTTLIVYTENWYQKHGNSNKLKTNTGLISKIIRFSQGDYVGKCEGKWYDSAKQFLRNNINASVFAPVLRDLLTKKGRNTIICGPANSGNIILKLSTLLFLTQLLTHAALCKFLLE